MSKKQTFDLERYYALILSVGGITGLIAMTWQSIERINMLKYPESPLSCSINPVVDCGGVLGDKLAAVLGFPNAFLGIIFFAILSTAGLLLLSGGKFVSWFRHFVMIVTLILFMFSIWFFSVSLYILGKICVFCVVGWIVSIPIFWYGLLYYLQSFGNKASNKLKSFLNFGLNHHLDVLVLTYGIMILLFIIRFREYYF